MVKNTTALGQTKKAPDPKNKQEKCEIGLADRVYIDDEEKQSSEDDTEKSGCDTDSSSVYSGLGESEEVEDSEISSKDSSGDEEEMEDSQRKGNNFRVQKVRLSGASSNEYIHDSSDEEDIRNTVGNIPMKWYDEYDHLGYDWDGRKIFKPPKVDELEKFLSKMDNPNYWKTIKDPMTGQDVVLADEDVVHIKRTQNGQFPDTNYNPYEPWIDFFTHENMIHPVSNRPEHKRSFIPSLVEKEKVSKMVYAIKMGWLKPGRPMPPKQQEEKFYLLWEQEDQSQISRRMQHFIPAPRMKLPGHEESYNPPPEYLFTKEEEEKWKNQEPEDRKLNFIPQKYSSLRAVPAYGNFIKERFERCLDLYLCPRQQKMRLNVDPEDLIPKLPKPKDLQPFPTTLSLIYKGHVDMIRCITVEPAGQFMASGCDDCTIKIWEVQTGRCMKTISTEGPVTSLAWCPNTNVVLIAATVNKGVIIFNPMVGDKLILNNTDLVFDTRTELDNGQSSNNVIEWRLATDDEQEKGYRMIVQHSKDVKQVTWHCKGDYFASVMPSGGNASVQIHQLSKHRSQQPFNKSKGLVQCVLFHPTRPYLFVATQRYVRIYNLMKQELTKKLLTNCKWVSSMAIHPGGDNLIIGSYDNRLGWFDLDLSSKPYQTLRNQKKALRQVAFHRRYPLFASASDDGSVIVCHGMVYNDLLQNPLIVPVKVLHGHKIKNDVGVMDCQFHPTQPWIFTSAADGNIHLYT